MRPSEYDDGLDADGYPIEREPRQPYRRGSEEAAIGWQPSGLAEAARNVSNRARHLLELAPKCDSPIETQLGSAIQLMFDRAKLPAELVPQFAWSFYRTDWAVVTPSGLTLLVECDGYEFHSSPEQVAHDARKDEAARGLGYRTLRFTGSQIHRDVDACARKVFDAVCGP